MSGVRGGSDAGGGGDHAARAALEALRDLVPRVVGAVTRRAGDFAAAEDAVQEALMAAATEWPARGAPGNPAGWLFHVACRRLADQQDAEQARRRREAVVAEAAAGTTRPRERDEPFPGADADDDTLLLLFLCCHPALAPASAVALTLRAVGGLSTREIAGAFLVPEATMAQRISRAKQAIRDAGARFELPDPGERERRRDSVRHVLYLLFNEGYLRQEGDELLRAGLSGEAIRLARLLDRAEPGDPETEGLLALMLLTDARRPARTGPAGELIPLHEQDRSRWDGAAIAEGSALAETALRRGRAGAFQVQAAIAALHDEAASVETTDWRQVLGLYELLERLTGNPLVALNRAVALAMVRGPAAGLEALLAIESAGGLGAQKYRIDAVRGHLLERAGDPAAAALAYERAAAATASAVERRYLEAAAARTRSPGAPPPPA